MAAATATNVTSSSASTTTTTSTSSSSSLSPSTSSSTTATTTNPSISHNNFHELCRSCGKTNAAELLYDLFPTTNSPFNTSSTTCYTHLNNSNTSCSTSKCSLSSKSSLSSLTFDSVAATAKATAKGQSNMDNILQEMQIWQLMIKCNDGLPQRICAKCTAQFYMIHKFRRKCLKVQTQLRALNEEQKFYERQQQQKDATATTTKPAATASAVASKIKTLDEPNDLANDNCKEQQQQATVDNSKSSVSFETQTGNTDEVSKLTNATTPTLLDNVETMTEKTEATATATTLGCHDKSFAKQEHCATATSCSKVKDEKKPLLKAAVLKFRNTPLLTLQQPPLKQICDNDATQLMANVREEISGDQEDLLDTHIIFKAFEATNKTIKCQVNDEEMSIDESPDRGDTTLGVKEEHKELFNFGLTNNKNNNESLFLTKAALKAYTPTSIKTTNAKTQQQTIEDTNSNDNNNNNNESNDNTCSSTSTYSSSSKVSSHSRKSLRRKVFKHKTCKYLNIGKRSQYHKYKSNNKLNIKKLNLKKTTRSWQNKHVRTCSAATLKQRKQRQTKKKSLKQAADIQMEDETSSNVSTTSSSAMTTSSSLSAEIATTTTTTPAVTDLLVNNKTGFSSISPRISSNKSSTSCIMWKTKAAMKANANDMPTTLPYTANDSTTGSASENTDKSSKTLDENQSISSSTNNFRQEGQDDVGSSSSSSSTNTVMSLPDNQVKDTADDEREQNLNHNLWPEEADQKQITNYTQKETEENKQIDQTKDTEVAEDMEPPKSIASKKIGGMKLIIQRKRGARFKCRRKTEDEPCEASKPKRRRKTNHNQSPPTKYEIESIFSLDLNAEYRKENKQDLVGGSDMEETVDLNIVKRKLNAFNSAQDENKENPISLHHLQECDSDSNTSVYRDPLLIKNDMLEDDTQLTDFPKPQLSLQSECTKEMFKLCKEKFNLESPKKLIVRVPLTSLTQDFKRLHLTMETESEENEQKNEALKEEQEKEEKVEEEINMIANETGITEEIASETAIVKEQQLECNNTTQNISSTQANSSSSQSDLMGFSQNSETSSSSTADSSQPSVDLFRYVQPPLCSASSKITDFINDFQNNCIDSSEIEETTCDMVPQLGPQITQELSDEIRDVEDTLNGILSEMHDKDMYTPRSAETDELFPHSVYSPLTDSPTTPAHSFYAESPCTINSNPMSVSPFIHQNMDYNAMTPQSNHSSMGHSSHMGGSSVSGGSTGPHTTGVFIEHFPTYTECFEESTQSELIGFQNDIPCFENIEISQPPNSGELLGNQGEFNEEDNAINDNEQNIQNMANESGEIKTAPAVVDYIDLSDYKENNDHFSNAAVQEETVPEITVTNRDLLTQQIPYNPNNYQHSIQMQSTNNPLIPGSANMQPHYIVTNTNQGPIIFANRQLNQAGEHMEGAFKAHGNNLQFVTLGQAMEAANQAPIKHLIHNNAQDINWPSNVNASQNYAPQQVISTANGTTTYFINANGELYQASIPAPALNTIIMQNNSNQASQFNKSNMDNNDNYMQTLQQQQQHQQHQQQNPNSLSSQYIMLVNNLGGTPQYYATTQAMPAQTAAAPQQQQQHAVLFQRHSTKYQTNSSKTTNNCSNERNPPLAPKPIHKPISPALDKDSNSTATSMRQRVNQQLQQQIKQRQLQLLQPRSANVTQKITLICRFCHKRPKFTNNVDYSNHIINMHPAEKPYNCPHCPMHFSRRFERQQHVAQVHGSRYQCAQCGLSFCAQRTLDFHLQKYHANLGRSQQQHLHHQQQQQQNSTSTSSPATYQLLQQHNQQQRLVRVEDVHVQVSGENKNKRSIDLPLESSSDIQTSLSMPEVEILSGTPTGTPQQQSQARILCSPDCNDDNDDCCGSNQNYDQTNNTDTPAAEHEQQYTGNESVNNNHHHQQQQQHQHITIPSPEQTEPDSTTTLRHFRKRQLSEISPHFAASPSSSSSSAAAVITYTFNNNNGHNNDNNNININHNSPDNVLTDETGAGSVVTGRRGVGASGGEQIMVERTLRGSHNCLLCEESFTNEIALRKHHHLAHGATQTINNTLATSSSSSSSSGLVCTICKRSFRMRNALQRHMETHDAEGRPYECNICQVRFPRPSQLTLHKLTVHKFEKPNSCEECGKQFGTETAMKAHAKEHEQEAANAATATEALTSTSSSTSSTPASSSQLSSRVYLETMTTKTTSISTSKIITNEQQTINLAATTSGEDETAAATNNNNNNEDDNAFLIMP
ncbi:putative mediator of RNA polymerase II transcription subunit 26 [Lucilia cuprina]|uniref:putative mediator of RNA polymerase II transcription subunit 26 n=1 Tax=Lucilia cuprina TaxID=7375 RepID=UPI001F05D405|nr:putative mediator of RNA polymerase II transcription subunit 26 [Lucilia cuprina]